MSYNRDRAYGERFISLVKPLVGPHLLEPSPFEIDTKQAADLVVLHAKPLTIGVRIRRPGYASKYPFDFTIRSRRNNGNRTELAKICDGWMDWMFYGHGNDEASQPELLQWMLINMHIWRRECIIRGSDGVRRSGLVVSRENSDGETHFKAFDVRRWPTQMVINGSTHVMLEAGRLYKKAA